MSARRKVLIDTDTASDDAVALLMALRASQPGPQARLVEVVAITVVAGNVPVEQGVRNALLSVELCGADVQPSDGILRLEGTSIQISLAEVFAELDEF